MMMMTTMMIIMMILSVLGLNNTFCIKNISLVFTSIYIHCYVSQSKQPPNQPRLRHRKPLVCLRGVGIRLWEKPRTNTALPEDFASTASQS